MPQQTDFSTDPLVSTMRDSDEIRKRHIKLRWIGRKPENDADKCIVDFGSPLVGIILGLLLIACSVAVFVLWDNYSNGGNAEVAIAMAQSK